MTAMFNQALQAQVTLGTGLLITLLSAFVIAALVFLMLAALNLLRARDLFSKTGYELAIEVLDERLQRGEIDGKQYHELRAQLEAG
jgi:uncharacterized membrane protein